MEESLQLRGEAFLKQYDNTVIEYFFTKSERQEMTNKIKKCRTEDELRTVLKKIGVGIGQRMKEEDFSKLKNEKEFVSKCCCMIRGGGCLVPGLSLETKVNLLRSLELHV